MMSLTFFRQILNLIRDALFVVICTRHIPPREHCSRLRSTLGYLFLFVTLFMYSAESSSIFSDSSVRTIFRILCYLGFIFCTCELRLPVAVYDALFLNTICTITHNFFLTPLTRPTLLNTIQYVKDPVLNWVLCFVLVNIVVITFDFIVYKATPLHRIAAVNRARVLSLCTVMLGSIYLNYTLRTITDINLEQTMELSTYAIISQLTLFCCVVLLEQIQWKTQSQLESHMETISTRAMLENIKKQSTNDDKIRQIRHDLKNHLNSIYYLVKAGQDSECLHYINQLLDNYTQPGIMVHTGNHILDNIISQKLTIAAEKHIMTSFSADFSALNFIDDTDACIIFANLLDNAIEASEKVTDPEKRYIDIRSSIKGNQCIYRIENSFNGVLVSHNNHFDTTKKDHYLHGIGLKSVDNAIKKYNGILHIDADKETLNFRVVLIFPVA